MSGIDVSFFAFPLRCMTHDLPVSKPGAIVDCDAMGLTDVPGRRPGSIYSGPNVLQLHQDFVIAPGLHEDCGLRVVLYL